MTDMHPPNHKHNSAALAAGERQSPPKTVQEALAALQASRAVLRRELVPATRFAPEASEGTFSSWQRSWRRWRRLGSRWPIAAAARDVVRGWWRKQPWHATGALAAEGLYQHAVPVVRRHPIVAIGVAAGLGALLVSVRPWRWPLVGDQLQATPRRLRSWAVNQLMSAPIQAALASLLWMAVQRQQPEAPSTAAGPVAPDAAPQAQPPLQTI